MVNEAFKNQRLSSHEIYQLKRWEGKPWSFKFRFLVANHPEIALGGLVSLICPFIVYYKYYSYKGSRREAIRKFKPVYSVVRDDDPKVPAIMKEKEFGKEFFPKF